ncbi:MAG TPA: efflux RND transporter periplasmic adaptor subunit [Anaerolineae bacterium]|nr:efflux RND transporter periplasmic adaptor subunit [Anaerolineae bacterium]
MSEHKKFKIEKKTLYIVMGIIAIIATVVGLSALRSNSRNADDLFQTIKLKRGDLVAIVGATGTVQANQSANLIWQTSGRVVDIYVDLNDTVEKGQVLAELEETSLPQSIILAQADLVSAQRALEDLLASNTQQKQVYLNLLDSEENLRTAEDDRDQWNYNNASQGRIEEARQKFIEAEEELKKFDEALSTVIDLAEDDAKRVSAQEANDEAQLKRDKALRNLNYILGKAYVQQVAEDYAKYDIAKAELEDAQREWERIRYGPNADDIRAAEAKVNAAKATVSLASLEAPFSGHITESQIKVGDEVSAGTPGFRVDDLSKLIIDVEVPEVDINRVQVNQAAELTFDGILGKTYHGKIIEVASVGNTTQGDVNFIIKVEMVDEDQQVKPGMTAAVNIIVSKLQNVITVPNRAVRLDNGKRVIYIMRDGEATAVEVQIGASSDVDTEIIAGDLHIGDLIVLNPPFEFEQNGGRPPFMR